jgi:hypothetical protein
VDHQLLSALYETTSKNGATYYRGRMGMVNVVLLKTKEASDTGQAIWSLVVSEAPRRDDYQPRTGTANHQAPPDRELDAASPNSSSTGAYGFDRKLEDEIPFASPIA